MLMGMDTRRGTEQGGEARKGGSMEEARGATIASEERGKQNRRSRRSNARNPSRDAEASNHPVTFIGLQVPVERIILVVGGGHACFEVNVLSQVKPTTDVSRVFQNLGLWCVSFGPFPLLFKFGRKRERVGEALSITTSAGVPVPVPGAAHIVSSLKYNGRHTELPEFM